MSTHAGIARKAGEQYEGVYCHHDGYPDGVGQQLIDWLAGQPRERQDFVVNKLMAEPIGWSSLCDTNIDLEPAWREYSDEPDNNAPKSYYASGEREDTKHFFEDLGAFYSYFGLSYIYLIDLDTQMMEVYGDLWNEAKLLAVVSLSEYSVLSVEDEE